jgi:hypothetical protein
MTTAVSSFGRWFVIANRKQRQGNSATVCYYVVQSRKKKMITVMLAHIAPQYGQGCNHHRRIKTLAETVITSRPPPPPPTPQKKRNPNPSLQSARRDTTKFTEQTSLHEIGFAKIFWVPHSKTFLTSSPVSSSKIKFCHIWYNFNIRWHWIHCYSMFHQQTGISTAHRDMHYATKQHSCTP